MLQTFTQCGNISQVLRSSRGDLRSQQVLTRDKRHRQSVIDLDDYSPLPGIVEIYIAYSWQYSHHHRRRTHAKEAVRLREIFGAEAFISPVHFDRDAPREVTVDAQNEKRLDAHRSQE